MAFKGKRPKENSREEVPESVEITGERVRVSEEEVREPDRLSALNNTGSSLEKKVSAENHGLTLESRKVCAPASG